jgi:hypothetical protein
VQILVLAPDRVFIRRVSGTATRPQPTLGQVIEGDGYLVMLFTVGALEDFERFAKEPFGSSPFPTRPAPGWTLAQLNQRRLPGDACDLGAKLNRGMRHALLGAQMYPLDPRAPSNKNGTSHEP